MPETQIGVLRTALRLHRFPSLFCPFPFALFRRAQTMWWKAKTWVLDGASVNQLWDVGFAARLRLHAFQPWLFVHYFAHHTTRYVPVIIARWRDVAKRPINKICLTPVLRDCGGGTNRTGLRINNNITNHFLLRCMLFHFSKLRSFISEMKQVDFQELK